MSGSTVLIVDDEHTLARSAKAFLADHGYEAEVASTGEQALELLERLQPDVVFADVRLPGMSGLDLLKRIRDFDPVIPVIMVTAYGSIEGAVEAVKLGAFDYVKKPVDLEELKLLADRARENRLLKQELSYYRRRATRDVGLEGLVGESPAIRAVLERARQIAALDETPPVLLTGETGTGKGLLAHAIHASGSRAVKAFIEVNCTALPATLMEAELFGYERGAFTDAKESKPGLVEAAEGGFLFLDEIGDVDLSVQGKLLRAIEERAVRRVGSVRERKIDVHIIAATNRDLEREVRQERFRKDLYFRLAVIVLHVPPLRERGARRAALERALPAGVQREVRESGARDQCAGARPDARVPVARERPRAQPRHRARRVVESGSDPRRRAPVPDEPAAERCVDRPRRVAAAGWRPGRVGKVDDRAGDARSRGEPDQGGPASRHLARHAALPAEEVRVGWVITPKLGEMAHSRRSAVGVHGAGRCATITCNGTSCEARARGGLDWHDPCEASQRLVVVDHHRFFREDATCRGPSPNSRSSSWGWKSAPTPATPEPSWDS